MGWSLKVSAIACKVPTTGQIMSSGRSNVRLNLTPLIGVGQKLIVDLKTAFESNNDSNNGEFIDYVNLNDGTIFGRSQVTTGNVQSSIGVTFVYE